MEGGEKMAKIEGQEEGEDEAGPLVAQIRNLLMPQYDTVHIPLSSASAGKKAAGIAGGGCFYAWAADSEAMERLGASLQLGLGSQPGTVVLLHGRREAFP